ncbi:hypothetical protein H4219_003706 [Mycoemilia scoparia]|uniref:Sugar phosphate transporter domain-containing protein n=1 Tax=Mycoemilia scoparia TaxID=417184 RepID=A0A9W8A3F9_9FUNG|nr:hypothetical protein H4219_003706 [Mycoemilia scoparia]
MSTVVMMPIWLFSSESGYMYRVMASDQPQEYKSLDDSVTSNSGSSPKHLIFLIVVGCVTNFFQSLLSINLLSVTNAVSYSIASLLKRVFVIGASIVWFQQPVTFLQTSGILIAFVGLYLYEQSKSKRTSPTTVGLDNNYVRSASDLQSQAQ